MQSIPSRNQSLCQSFDSIVTSHTPAFCLGTFTPLCIAVWRGGGGSAFGTRTFPFGVRAYIFFSGHYSIFQGTCTSHNVIDTRYFAREFELTQDADEEKINSFFFFLRPHLVSIVLDVFETDATSLKH